MAKPKWTLVSVKASDSGEHAALLIGVAMCKTDSRRAVRFALYEKTNLVLTQRDAIPSICGLNTSLGRLFSMNATLINRSNTNVAGSTPAMAARLAGYGIVGVVSGDSSCRTCYCRFKRSSNHVSISQASYPR